MNNASGLSPYLVSALNTVDPDVLLKIALERKGAARVSAPPPDPWDLQKAPGAVIGQQGTHHLRELERAEMQMFGPDADRGGSPDRIDPTGAFGLAAFQGHHVPEAAFEPKQIEPHLLAVLESYQSQIGTLRAQNEVLVNKYKMLADQVNECLSILRALQNATGMMGA